MNKTSVLIDDELLKLIDDYRAESRPIPSLSRAVIDLIKRGLSEKKTNIKEDNKLENITLHIRDPSQDRGGEAHLNLAYSKMKELGFNDKDIIDLIIVKR